MTNILYKDRRIIAFARFDEDTKFWIPMADIQLGEQPSASIAHGNWPSTMRLKVGRLRKGL